MPYGTWARRWVAAAVAAVGLFAAARAPAAPWLVSERWPRGPVVLLHGIRGTAAQWAGAVPELRRAGYDPIVIEYEAASPAQHHPEVAALLVQPALEAALQARGWGPDAPVSFVGHSSGGLLARFLVEQPGADADAWDEGRGWHGDGVPDVSPRWSRHTRAVVMIATPNHGAGTGLAGMACRHMRDAPFRSMACDVAEDSTFLGRMRASVPRTHGAPRYLGIGAAPPLGFSFGEADHDRDGLAHGNDGAVVAESAYLSGGSFALWRGQVLGNHSRLSCNDGIVRWVVDFLRDPDSFPEWQTGGLGVPVRDLCKGRKAPPSVWAGHPERRPAHGARLGGPEGAAVR